MTTLRPAMGIDYGKVRIGVAFSDLTRSFAFGQKTIANSRKKTDEVIAELVTLAKERDVDTIVIGLPARTDGKESDMANEVRAFADQLAEAVDCRLIFEDERFTSKIAQDNFRETGLSSRKARDVIDQRAAELILQSYLDKNRPR